VVAFAAEPALAQIVREKPRKVKAANRRALREARDAEVPYKDTHLDVSKDRLKRGSSEPKNVTSNSKLNYKTGKAPNVKPGFLGLRRKKKL